MAFDVMMFKPEPAVISSVIIAIVVICLLMWIYHNYINTQPVGALTATQYGQLPAAAQANYKVNTSGYYVPNGQTLT